jgi:hypothetical protein
MTITDTLKATTATVADVTLYARALHDLAYRTAKIVGFSYIGVPDADAPATLEAMTDAALRASTHSVPYPVSSEHCEDSIVGAVDPSANMALRFTHDMHHVSRRLGTSFPDEIELGYILVDEMTARYGDAVGRLAEIDMVGSTLWLHEQGVFPAGADLLSVV